MGRLVPRGEHEVRMRQADVRGKVNLVTFTMETALRELDPFDRPHALAVWAKAIRQFRKHPEVVDEE